MESKKDKPDREEQAGKFKGVHRSADDDEDVRDIGEEVVDYLLPEIKEFGPEDMVS